MVNYNEATLDRTFYALADATRRGIIDALARGGEQTVSRLAEPFAISLPAIMKHLRILADAGLVIREKRGRTVHCRLDRRGFQDTRTWLEDHERFWNENLDRLERYLED